MDVRTLIQQKIDAVKEAGRYRKPEVGCGTNFIANDYLGISKRLVDRGALTETIRECDSLGSTGSRLLGGHYKVFELLESEMAQFFGSPNALYFSSGYLANLCAGQVLSSLVEEVVSDEKNHASLIDGLRLSKTPKHIIAHNQWQSITPPVKPTLYVAEALYSMDGDLCDYASLGALTDSPYAFLHIDEAHSAGIMKESGQGYVTPDICNWDQTVVTITLGKAFGLSGALLLCSDQVKELFVNFGRSFIYTTAAPPIMAQWALRALALVKDSGELRRTLWSRSEQVRSLLEECPAYEGQVPVIKCNNLWARRSPIIPFRIVGEKAVLSFAGKLQQKGIALKAIRYPTVAKGEERLRISLNLNVDERSTLKMAEEVKKQWMEYLSPPQTLR